MLNELIESTLDLYNKELRSSVIKNQIPILWFGDLDKYCKSETKIITVSLNPSNNEFGNPKKGILYNTQYRFADYNGTIESIKLAYNNYFKKNRNPYGAWFKSSFDAILKGFDASHFDLARNNALHTDIALPFATDPTWTRLSNLDKKYFESIGQHIWHSLVVILQPDIILFSASRTFKEKIVFPKVFNNWDVIIPNERFPVLFNQFKVGEKITDVIFQTQGRKPFLNLTNIEKQNMKDILELHKDAKTKDSIKSSRQSEIV